MVSANGTSSSNLSHSLTTLTNCLETLTRKCCKLSKKIRKVYKKVSALNSFFSNVPGLGFAALLKKKLNHRCFPVNLGTFLEGIFYKTPTNRCFYMLL